MYTVQYARNERSQMLKRAEGGVSATTFASRFSLRVWVSINERIQRYVPIVTSSLLDKSIQISVIQPIVEARRQGETDAA